MLVRMMGLMLIVGGGCDDGDDNYELAEPRLN